VTCLATDRSFVKRDGRKAEAEPACGGTNHEEAEAQEGQVDCRAANPDSAVQTSGREEQDPEDDVKDPGRHILGTWLGSPAGAPA
jgi:hypothetical protein